jgi:hypothetical protein
MIRAMNRTLLALLLAAAFAWGSPAEAQTGPLAAPRFGRAKTVCKVEDRRFTESSGLAVSRRDPDLFWTHNDSGGEPEVYAFDRSGAVRGVVRLSGARAVDWEDMASFQRKKKPYLLVADVGDNDFRRGTYQLYVLPEPKLRGAEPVDQALALTLEFRYPDGPRNCEAVAVDGDAGTIYLATKDTRAKRSEVFSLALPKRTPKGPVEATPIAELPLRLVTAMDLSPDGRRAVVITYSTAYFYERGEEEDWGAAFGRGHLGQRRLPRRKQGESVTYGAEGRSLYLTSEYLPMPLFELPAEDAPAEAGNGASDGD